MGWNAAAGSGRAAAAAVRMKGAVQYDGGGEGRGGIAASAVVQGLASDACHVIHPWHVGSVYRCEAQRIRSHYVCVVEYGTAYSGACGCMAHGPALSLLVVVVGGWPSVKAVASTGVICAGQGAVGAHA